MKKISTLLLFVILSFGFILIKPAAVEASEGTFEVRSVNQESYRCWAASLFMPNNRYRVIVGCVDLIYPPQPPDLYKYYYMWATPTAGGNAMRLGALGGGKGNFEVRAPFSQLFVSLEVSSNPKTPSGQIVMRGSTQPINFLLRPTSPTPTPKADEQVTGTPTEEKAPADTSQLSTKDKLVLALRRAGIAAVVALVVIIGLVFVVSKSRG